MILTPDGYRYIALAGGQRVPRPFCLRWLVPRLCGRSDRRWEIMTVVGVAVGAVGTGLLGHGLAGVAAGVMFAALPMNRFNLQAPVLVDAPALAAAVLAAAAWGEGLWWCGLLLTLVSGATKESAPAFAALYAWTPWLLVGLVAPLVRAFCVKPGPDVVANPYADRPHVIELCALSLAHPFRAGWQTHKQAWFDGLVMLAPWGGVLAAFGNLSWPLVACLMVAYGQLLVATDSVRLYQWAAPLMCVAAATAVPLAWLPLLVALTIWNPWRGNGV